ncbi:AsmA family protein [Pseudomaricurvus sp. HS19]|uniref:AsmA family protein n=1 Tax=Pseudomaricurvus sp. HS19 TaxID=2692626 RepID=UPI0013691593|nr:AsmA family protein [Pseudomaricurvus sp. HS19]
MKALLKWSALLLAGLLGLVVVALVGLLMWLDPNDYRDELQQLAAEQGIPLQLRGDLGWQLWPRLGISVGDVELGEPGQPLLQARSLSGQVAILPLFSGQVIVEAIYIEGADIRLQVAADGSSNWDFLLQDESVGTAPEPATQAPGADTADSASPLQLAVESLQIVDSALRYDDRAQDVDVSLDQVQVTSSGLNLTGQPFRWQHSMRLQLPERPPLLLGTEGLLGVNLETSQLQLQDFTVTATANDSPLSVQLNGEVLWQTPSATLQLAMPQTNLAQWLTQWQIELPPMAAADALNKVSLQAAISGSGEEWQVRDLDMAMDQTRWQGQLASGAKGLSATLSADRLDLDRYLPLPEPASDPGSTPVVPAKSDDHRVVPLLSDEPLPLDDLKTLHAKAEVRIGELVYQQLPMQKVVVKLLADGKQVALQQLSTNLQDGGLKASASLTLDAQPLLQVNSSFTQMPLQTLLTTFADETRLAGKADGDVKITSRGNSLRQWQQQLVGDISLRANTLTLATVDVERSACELAALVNQEPVPAIVWQNQTTLQDMTTDIAIRGDKVTVSNLQAGVENLRVKTTGKLGLDNGKFEFPLSVAFSGSADPERDCQVRDRWRNRDLPLRCKGKLHDLSAKACLPDSKRLDDLLRDEAKAKATEKVQEKLQEKLGDEGKVVEDLLKDLFKKR